MRSIARLCEAFLSDFPESMEKYAGKQPALALGGSAAEKAILEPLYLLQEEVLKEHADTARRRKEAAEAAATPEERVILYAAKKDAAKELQKQEVRALLLFC